MYQILDFDKIHNLRERLALYGHDIGVPDAAKTIDDLLLVVETQEKGLEVYGSPRREQSERLGSTMVEKMTEQPYYVAERDEVWHAQAFLRGEYATKDEARAAINSILEERDAVVFMLHWPEGLSTYTRENPDGI